MGKVARAIQPPLEMEGSSGALTTDRATRPLGCQWAAAA